MTSVKHTSIPQGFITLGLRVHIHTIVFKSLNWRYRRFVASHQLRVLLRINQMWTDAFYSKEGPFFGVIQTTSKHWARWSLYLPCWGCVYCECDHSEAPGPFISFFIEVDVVREHKARPGNKRGFKKKHGPIVVEWASFLCLWICKICFSCMFKWELLYILMLTYVCVFNCFPMTSAFSRTVAVPCFFLLFIFFSPRGFLVTVTIIITL